MERQGQLHACIHTGVSEGNVSSEKLKICIFETEIVHYGDISANLDQALSKKKKKKKKKKKPENTCKKAHTQFLRPNWPKFCIWEEFLIIVC